MSISLPFHTAWRDSADIYAHSPFTTDENGGTREIGSQPDTDWYQARALSLSAPAVTGGVRDEAGHGMRFVTATHGQPSNQRVQNQGSVELYTVHCLEATTSPPEFVFLRVNGDDNPQRLQLARNSDGTLRVYCNIDAASDITTDSTETLPLDEVFELWIDYDKADGGNGTLTVKAKRKSDADWVTFVTLSDATLTQNLGALQPYALAGPGGGVSDGTYGIVHHFLEAAGTTGTFGTAGPKPLDAAHRGRIINPDAYGAKGSLLLESGAIQNGTHARMVYGVGDSLSIETPWVPLTTADEQLRRVPYVEIDLLGLPPDSDCAAAYEIGDGSTVSHRTNPFRFRTLSQKGSPDRVTINFGCCSDQYGGDLGPLADVRSLLESEGEVLHATVFCGDPAYEDPLGYAAGSVIAHAENQVARATFLGTLSYYIDKFSQVGWQKLYRTSAVVCAEDDHPFNNLDRTWQDNPATLDSLSGDFPWYAGVTTTLGEAWDIFAAIRRWVAPPPRRPHFDREYGVFEDGCVRVILGDSRFTSDRAGGEFMDSQQRAWLERLIKATPRETPYNVLLFQGNIDYVGAQNDSPSFYDLDGCQALFQYIAENAPPWSRWFFGQGDTHVGPYVHTRFKGTNGALLDSDKLVAIFNCSPVNQVLAHDTAGWNDPLAVAEYEDDMLYDTDTLPGVDRGVNLSGNDVFKSSGYGKTLDPMAGEFISRTWVGDRGSVTLASASLPVTTLEVIRQQQIAEAVDSSSELAATKAAAESARDTVNDPDHGNEFIKLAADETKAAALLAAQAGRDASDQYETKTTAFFVPPATDWSGSTIEVLDLPPNWLVAGQAIDIGGHEATITSVTPGTYDGTGALPIAYVAGTFTSIEFMPALPIPISSDVAVTASRVVDAKALFIGEDPVTGVSDLPSGGSGGGPVLVGEGLTPFMLQLTTRAEGYYKATKPARIRKGETPLAVLTVPRWGVSKFTAMEQPASADSNVATAGTQSGSTYGIHVGDGWPSCVVSAASAASEGDTTTVGFYATAGGQRILVEFDVEVGPDPPGGL